MKVVLTGATGFIGSHVLADLYKHGHEVTAPVRDQAQADTVAARGATPVVADLYDRPAVTRLLGRADGAIHTASPGNATSANLDSELVDAVIDTFAGTDKPYLQISGLWIYGANRRALEDESARGRYDRASARGVTPRGGHRRRSAECYTGPGRGNPARFAASWPQPTVR